MTCIEQLNPSALQKASWHASCCQVHDECSRSHVSGTTTTTAFNPSRPCQAQTCCIGQCPCDGSNGGAPVATGQDDVDFAVFRFTLGIPGFDDDLIPRVVGVLGAVLLTANHLAAGSAAGSAALVGARPHLLDFTNLTKAWDMT